MSSDQNSTRNIRQVFLPSGKMIEVIYFEQPGANAVEQRQGRADAASVAQRSETPASEDQLHVCPRCASQLVYPVDWSESGPAHWEVDLRCPDCEWNGSGIFSQDSVERFDAELDRGADALLHDLQHLSHANMAEEIERFTDALNRGHILPCDF